MRLSAPLIFLAFVGAAMWFALFELIKLVTQ